MRTDLEIKTEIEKLKAMKPAVRRRTFFGDDNWESVDAQVECLERHFTEDDLWGRWASDRDEYPRDAAREALEWMTGESDQPPSKEWEQLVAPTSVNSTLAIPGPKPRIVKPPRTPKVTRTKKPTKRPKRR